MTGVALLLAVVSGALVWGYVTAGGAGTGAAASGTAAQVTLTPAAPTTLLYPGGTASVVMAATNPNPGPVRIVSLSLDTTQASSGFAVDTDHAGCAVSALSFTTQTNGGAGWTLPPGSTSISLPAALAMSPSAANACQGASFTVYVKTGAS